MTDNSDWKTKSPIAISVTLLCVSVLISAWFILGSFVTYAAPPIDAGAMQNIYLTRIALYGSTIAILNFLAGGTLVFGWDLRAKRQKP
jgi:hypothetical protein